MNVAILAVLAGVLLYGPPGKSAKGVYDRWQARRVIAEVWPSLVQGSSRLAASTVQSDRTIIEFIDYQCPHCRRGAARVFDAVALETIDVVVRHLPLDRIHPSARQAAAAAVCGERLGAFDVVHSQLLANDDWMGSVDWGAWAATLGIREPETFAGCLEDAETARRIANDMRLAARLGVTGTPTFVTVAGVFPGDFDGALSSLPDLPDATADNADLWQAVGNPRIEVGSVFDSSFSFHGIAGIVLLGDGRIVVGNNGTSELLLFGPEGEFRKAVGRRGDGPGEFLGIEALGVGANDTLFVLDRRLGRISVFDSLGELARTAAVDAPVPDVTIPIVLRGTGSRTLPSTPPLPLSPAGWAAGRLVAWREVRDTASLELSGSSTLVQELRAGRDVVRSQRPAAELLFFDGDGTLLGQAGDLLAPEQVSLTQTESGSGGSFSMTVSRLQIPFQKTLETAAAWDVVAVGNTDSYEIRILSPDGQEMTTIRQSTGPLEVPDGYRERWIRGQVAAIGDSGARRERQQLLETVDFPTTMPAFRSLAVQEGGRVWVEDYRMPENEEGPSTWQVYDLDSRHLGEVVLPAGFRLFLITKDSAVGVWKDDLEVEYVHVYALDRIEG